MLESSALYSRLFFVLALVCLALVTFTISSDAARAGPETTQVDSGVRHVTLKQLYSSHSPTRPPFTSQPSFQTGGNIESEKRGIYRVVPSMIYHQSNPVRLTGGSLGYTMYTDISDNRPSQAGTTSVPSGMNPASSHPPLNIRKSSSNEAASPSQVWDTREAWKSSIKDKVPLFSSQTGRYWSPLLPTSRGLHSSYKETNELTSAGPRRTSSGIPSSKSLALERKTAPRPTSIRRYSDASLIKSSLGPERLTESVADFSQGSPSVSRSEMPRRPNIQGYLLKDSQAAFGRHETVPAVPYHGPAALASAPHKHRASEVVGSFFPGVEPLRQSQRKPPTKDQLHLFDNANPLHPNDNYYQARTDGYAQYQNTAQISAPGRDAIVGGLKPLPSVNFRGNHAAGDVISTESSFTKATPRGSMQTTTPGQSIKSLYGSRGFEPSELRAAEDPHILSSSEGSNSRGHSSNNRMGNPVSNMNPSLSQKYSFGRRETSAPLVKPQRTLTAYPSPSPGTQQDLTSGFKESWSRLPKRDAGVEREPDHRPFRTYGRIYGLKGFGTRSLETAQTSGSESPGVQQDFAGYKPRGLEILPPKSSRVNTAGRATPSREDHKPLLKKETTGSVSRYKSDEYDTIRKISHLLGFLPYRNGIRDPNNTAHIQNRDNPKINSTHLRRAVEPNAKTQLKFAPRKQDLTEVFPKKVSLFNGSAFRRLSDISLIKSVPSPESLTASDANIFQGSFSVSPSETPRRQKSQSYLFKDSQVAFGGHETVPAVPYHRPAPLRTAPHMHRAFEVVGGFPSYVEPLQQSPRKTPTKDQMHLFDNANPLHSNDNYYQARTDGYAEFQNTAQISAPGKDAIAGRLGNHGARDIGPAEISFSKATPRGSMQATTPGQSIKSLHGSRRFEPSELRTVGVESEPDHGESRTYGRIYGPKAFSTGSLETAQTSVSESAGLKQDYGGYKPGGSQISRQKNLHVNTAVHAAPSSEDHKPFLKTETPRATSRYTSDEYDTIRKISRLLGLPNRNRIEDADNTAHKQNRESPNIATAHIRAGDPNAETRPKLEPRKQDLTELFAKKASLFSGFTSSTVRGKRVRTKAEKLNETARIDNARKEAIVQDHRSVALSAIAQANILGSAVFGQNKARTRTLTASPDDNFSNTSAAAKQAKAAAAAAAEDEEGAGFWALESEDGVNGADNASGGPKEVEESQPAVRSKGVENGARTSAFFQDNEGSGSGGFDESDDGSGESSPDNAEGRGLDEDLAELEYLRISTGNISFKSMELPHTDA
ncbi:uncharacterized protein ACO6RY_03339 [Pungitius sinensis]